MKQLLQRLWDFIRQHWVAVSIIALIGVAALSAGVMAVVWFKSHGPQVSHSANGLTLPALKLPPQKVYSPLTGLEAANEAATKEQVRAVMIDNVPEARPQSGLKDAGVIFEADADGGITRFLVLYQEGHPSLIGPVRSVRPYYVDWLAAFDASISHVGGSAKALQEVRNGSFKDLDQFFNSGSYWRATDRYAPHNVYTSTDRLNALNNKKGYTTSSFTGFPRKDEAPSTAPNATNIDITVSSYYYNVHYDYDKPTNSYIRFEGGAKHTDREQGQLAPKVVIIMKIPTKTALEDGYRVDMQSIGSGGVYIFQDGIVTQGTWTKANQKAQIVFADSAGKPLALDRGQTWITVVAPERSVVWK